MGEILKIIDLKKIYGNGENETKALNGVSFTVNEGEFVSIVGSSGSGKSTLLNIIGGLDKPTDGEVWLNEKNLCKIPREEMTVFRRRNIGFIFQNYNLIPILNVYENIVLPLDLDGKEVDTDYLKMVLNTLKLDNKLENMANNLSGGQQQRVAIARALITKPQIILADEPTGNLDSKTSMAVVELLKNTSKEFHQTILMITHDENIANMAEKKIIIEDGNIKKRISSYGR